MSYAREAATALRLISAKGTDVTLTTPSTRVLDPATGDATTTAGTTAAVKAVVLPGKYYGGAISVDELAKLIRDSRRLVVAGSSWPLTEVPPGTTFVTEGYTWVTTGGKRIAPDGGAAIVHFVDAKRGPKV